LNLNPAIWQTIAATRWRASVRSHVERNDY
jgi:hypothetical protein